MEKEHHQIASLHVKVHSTSWLCNLVVVLTIGRVDCASRREGFRAVQGTAPCARFTVLCFFRGRAARWVGRQDLIASACLVT